jgi:hypothetical protein
MPHIWIGLSSPKDGQYGLLGRFLGLKAQNRKPREFSALKMCLNIRQNIKKLGETRRLRQRDTVDVGEFSKVPQRALRKRLSLCFY